MYKEISMTLIDGSEKKVPFLANGTTSYRFKQIFGADLMNGLTKIINSDLDGIGEDADFSVADKLAFLMNCQAEKKDLNCQNMDTFLEWMEQFDSVSFVEHMVEFMTIYLGNKKGTSNPKKAVEQ